MSSFIKKTLNPYTNRIEEAEWLDNFFSHRVYGVRFKNGMVYRESEIKKRTQANNIFNKLK